MACKGKRDGLMRLAHGPSGVTFGVTFGVTSAWGRRGWSPGILDDLQPQTNRPTSRCVKLVMPGITNGRLVALTPIQVASVAPS